MTAFRAAMAALVANRDLATAAQWRAGGTGSPVTVRVIRSSPDASATAFDATVIQATDVVTVAAADLPGIAAGDTLSIGSETLTVRHVERDATGEAITAYCRRD